MPDGESKQCSSFHSVNVLISKKFKTYLNTVSRLFCNLYAAVYWRPCKFSWFEYNLWSTAATPCLQEVLLLERVPLPLYPPRTLQRPHIIYIHSSSWNPWDPDNSAASYRSFPICRMLGGKLRWDFSTDWCKRILDTNFFYKLGNLRLNCREHIQLLKIAIKTSLNDN